MRCYPPGCGGGLDWNPAEVDPDQAEGEYGNVKKYSDSAIHLCLQIDRRYYSKSVARFLFSFYTYIDAIAENKMLKFYSTSANHVV